MSKTFKCDFGSISCEVTISDKPPEKLSMGTHIANVQWTGKPDERAVRPYIAWMNSVNQQLANEWNIKIMHVFLTPNGGDVWEFEPGSKPKKIEH